MNITIGDTAVPLDKAQSIRGDFLWVLPFVDVAEDGTETDTDLTDCDFVFEILEADGSTSKALLGVGEGITVSGNDVSISMNNSDFSAWPRGCKYPYYLTYTNADGFKKCLFEGKFMLT
jgi:hypothetical protein